MQIKNAEFKDIPQLSDIMVQSFRNAFGDFISRETMAQQTDDMHCRTMMETIYRDSSMHFLMADQGGMLIWMDDGPQAEIMALHILPECRGTGLGHALLTEAISQIGTRPVSLWTFKVNSRARRFYEKHGFRWAGTERISDFDSAPEVRYILNPQ